MKINSLISLAAGLTSGLLFPSCQANDEKINIILIMTDDMGYEALGCNGGLSYNTPNLDEMARQGIRLTNCYSQPLCTPSRVKIMTGKYNYRNYEGFAYLNPKEITFGNVMKEAGYATCIIGKWQLNGTTGFGTLDDQWPGWDDKERPRTFGFDEYCLWQLTARESRYASPLIEQNGKVLEGLEDAYGPDVFRDYAIDFIERHKDQPFFLYYPMVLPHSPFVPTPDSREWADRERRDEEDYGYFKDMVEYLDKIVGAIQQKVVEAGIAEKTLIIFTSDNGTNSRITSEFITGEYPGGKGKTFNAGTHVPFIAYWPGRIEAGQVSDALVDFTDFLPTFAEMGGVEAESDGKSFLPLLKGEYYEEKDVVFIHYDLRLGPGVHEYHDRFARTKQYKLYEDGRFFHVPTDEWEENPISGRMMIEVIQTKDLLRNVIDQAPEWRTMLPEERFNRLNR